jgi:mannosyltransferase
LSATLLEPTVARVGPSRRAPVLLAALLGIFACAVSAAGSWIPSLWADEITSIMSAQRSLPSLLKMLGTLDAVHGTYYAGLHVWGWMFGLSPFAVRFPSAIAVGLATSAVVLLADRLRSRRAAVLAGLVCAIVPRLTYMGEEARSFALSAAIMAWLTLILVVALERNTPRRALWVAYGLLLAAGIYLFMYVVLVLAVHGVVLLASRVPRRTVWAWGVASGAGILAATPVLVYAFLEHGQIAYLAATDQVSPPALVGDLWFGGPVFAALAWAMILVGVGFAGRRVWMRGSLARSGPPGVPGLVSVALLWLLVPTLILLVMQAFVPDFAARYLTFCAPAAAILIACGVDDLLAVRRSAGVVAGALVILLALPVYVSQRTPYAKNQADLAEIAGVVGSHAQPGDAVVFDEGTRLSHRPRLAMHGYPAAFENVRDVAVQVPYQDNLLWHDEAYTVQDAAILGRFTGIHRVWLIDYASAPGKADRYGVRELEAIGYLPTGTRIPTHRGLVTLYAMTGSAR